MPAKLSFIIACLGLLGLAGGAEAQVTNVLPSGVPTGGLVPGSPFQMGPTPGVNSPLNGMSPQTMQDLMIMRAMSGGRHHGVQRGMPNPIIDGSYGSGIQPYTNNAPAAGSTGKRKSSEEKRAAIRAQKEERKRATKVAADNPKVSKKSKKKAADGQ